ncbi:CPBP family intramembrane glutamic endopeptidase [Haloarchaeobius amylolyticus]|uniref:CPBP family intramembrane glutamic endopeptidase n=1 Tax=Haloarchaeobius amylolyticus TaxID=1198296 RepID=A0ABD6BGK3_9EURY
MPQWETFVGLTGVVLVSLLVLSYLTQSAFDDGESDTSDGVDERFDAMDHDSDWNARAPDESSPSRATVNAPAPEPIDDERPAADDRSPSDIDDGARDPSQPQNVATSSDARFDPADRSIDPASLSTGALLANVAFSQGLFALLLLGAAVYTAIPAAALGIEFSAAYLERGVMVGTVAGISVYVVNELAAATATRLGFDHDETLRELLAPDSVGGWLVLLLGVLPIIAVFEEFLFRAALIGVPAAGFGLSPWLLAVGSSVAFALGHGMQGSVGVVVTGLLGFVLAAVFILTGSLLVVVVAHYLINALEFVVHEGIGLEWAETLER